ncbi:MAG: hypothetical protein A3B89_02410 [Candidatus Buchananbacteria bacterium RIFCSPHIGHO2_02_FULL_40_13]|uniref:Uncharacterized protein n=1 Tax=Candidatus Buchananbacteria bacterium RIFCSPLOWO2_01_FULL_39_33 TaxID=1797543 RepID=A0A1G1YL56_9BACT|nr:MAG: hypothetical protein A3B89_02410 [Candidatus Buchananbacteria bacterium RIFCSPHIGHO2_02_FULL_40_13]OGY53004.1 MAG: hypothetical protein A3A02_04835 [Candidatus Buchananbacteria bacterium RIFCSPLOWO2_01_FULL_39_33]
MSVNNYIKIIRQGEKFEVTERDADTKGILCFNKIFDTLEEAIKASNKYQEEQEVEYGLDIRL